MAEVNNNDGSVLTPKARHYGVIYADPPWTFQTYSEKGKGRSAEAHYDCMPFNEMCFLRAGERWAAENCVLLMWATDPLLKQALQLIDAWGFTYKTVGFYWMKTSRENVGLDYPWRHNWPIGTGYWTRANPEQCLLATRGKPKRLNADVRKLIVSPRREHSRKPDETYARIERLCAGPYLELFSRFPREGWDRWGLESETGPSQRRWTSKSSPGCVEQRGKIDRGPLLTKKTKKT